MFSVAAATFGVPAAPELLEGARRSATGRIRHGELDEAFFRPRMRRNTLLNPIKLSGQLCRVSSKRRLRTEAQAR
jgi:hypothetical protein